MLKLNEEAPQALAVVVWGRAPGLEGLQASEVVRWDRALVMEAHGWPLPQGIMCIPAQGFLDLAGLQTPEAPLILGAPSIRVTQIISSIEQRVLGPRRLC